MYLELLQQAELSVQRWGFMKSIITTLFYAKLIIYSVVEGLSF